MKYELPKLPYEYNGLEPIIDALTVELHYDRHHRGYLTKLNEALQNYQEFVGEKSVEDILSNISTIPTEIKQTVINTGGGFINHNLYWSILTPGGKKLASGKLLDAVNQTFGTIENLKEQLYNAALTVFGSGWAFLVVNKEKQLEIVKTANQNSPISEGMTPIIGIDVWEHAYYLNYQNKRADYLKLIWDILNWQEIERLYLQAIK